MDACWEATLDARLLTHGHEPVAVAFSGGGDSLALLLLAHAWSQRRGRRLIALTVDHRLRPAGADWARWCEARARALGVPHRTLVWEGPRPITGVAAAARTARHRLLADAARAAGARVILLGHTADDLAEAALMRREGSTVPSPGVWTPSPVWPQGRGIFLLRPLLGARRDEVRAALSALGETWIDDPANVDLVSARARARQLLAESPFWSEPARAINSECAGDVTLGPAGDLILRTPGGVSAPFPREVLGAALLCASGAERPPRGDPLTRLAARINSDETFTSTLAGARVSAGNGQVHLVRDAADARRAGGGDLALPANETVVWDGRFAVRAAVEGLCVGALIGRAARLPPPLKSTLRALSPATRRALPVVVHPGGALECPTLAASPIAQVHPVALERFAAATGRIVDELTLRRMAKGCYPP